MAFNTGLHIAFGYGGTEVGPSLPLTFGTLLAQTMTVGAGEISSIKAPGFGPDQLPPVVSLQAAQDCWVSIGPAPDDPSSAASRRRLVRAGYDVDWICSPGDFVRWAAA